MKNYVVSLSGGKDSTVLLHLLMAEAKRQHKQVGVLFVDLEGQSGTALTPPIPVTPSATGWVVIDVSSYHVQVYEDFVVAMFYDGVNTPSLGYDQEDNGRARDCYYSTQQDEYIWYDWEETYFIRASVALPTGQTVQLGQVPD